METKIIRLMIKYDLEIMKNTLGEDTDLKFYANTPQWDVCMGRVAMSIKELIDYGITIDPTGFAYAIISNWCNVMTFGEDELNLDGLIEVCKNILSELK